MPAPRIIILLALFLVLTSCELGGRNTSGGIEMGSAADREKAFVLIEDANQNIRSIKVLYRNNNSKIDELQNALKEGDLKKVKDLADELSLAINDGYLLADSILDKIERAEALNINSIWKEYLRLKRESIELQIQAFNYRRNTANLFRDKIGSEDPETLKLARDTFRKNEEGFKKYMAEAEKASKEADALRKDSLNRKN